MTLSLFPSILLAINNSGAKKQSVTTAALESDIQTSVDLK